MVRETHRLNFGIDIVQESIASTIADTHNSTQLQLPWNTVAGLDLLTQRAPACTHRFRARANGICKYEKWRKNSSPFKMEAKFALFARASYFLARVWLAPYAVDLNELYDRWHH